MTRHTVRTEIVSLFRLRTVVLVLTLLAATAVLPFLGRADLTEFSSGLVSRQKVLERVPGELLIRFRSEAATPKDRSVQISVASTGRQIPLVLSSFEGPEIVEGLRLARVAPDDADNAIEALKARPDVIYAEPNYIRRKDVVPNDPFYPELWGLKNTGQQGGSPEVDIQAEQAWGTTTGSRNIVVAVIDEGMDVNHQDLKTNIWRNSAEVAGNGLDDDGNGYVDDLNGYDFFHNDASVYDGPGTNPDGSQVDAHGTHVAGIIGAVGNNGVGVVGINWQVGLMSLKFLGPEGGSSADAIRAYAYAKQMRDRWVSSGGTQGANVRITNNSYGGDNYSQAEFDAIQGLVSSGILFVSSAGNESQDNNAVPGYPASYDLPSVVSVTAIDRTGVLSSFSNRGSRSVHVGAPGRDILSTTPGNTYSSFSGTSMASPHVAGTAALVLAAHPQFNLARLRAAILFGGQPSPHLDQTTVTGRLVSAAGSLQNAVETDSTSPDPVTDLGITSQDGRAVRLEWTATGDDANSGAASLYEIRFTDQDTGAKFLLATQRPLAAGFHEFIEVYVPYRHTAGTVTLLTCDNAGNSSAAATNLMISPEAAEPYTLVEGPAEALSTGGDRLGANFDDSLFGYGLPFNFPFFERFGFSILLSTNGAIYFSPSIPGDYDVLSTASRLSSFHVIAGIWDDLDLRTNARADADIYVVRPDPDRIIFRWQGVACNFNHSTGQCSGGDQVNFEIELRRDGTIITRYGNGNTSLRPVVGIGGAEPDSFVVPSHTSEIAPINLTNASTVTYSLRSLPKQADLSIAGRSYPNPVLVGGTITYTWTVTNAGPDSAAGVVVSDTLSVNSQYVSCVTSQGSCSGPTPGSTGTVLARLGSISANASATLTVVTIARIPQSSYSSNASVSGRTYDPNMSSNSSYIDTSVFVPNPNPLTGVTAIATGSYHSLALTSDGSVLAWGTNSSGQLGNGSNTDNRTPGWVKGLYSVSRIAAGGSHSVAIKPSGKVWTWGGNFSGQLGDGTTMDRSEPVLVSGVTAITAAAGAGHTIVVRNDGTVWAWGGNAQGQLGDATNDNRLSPVQVDGLTAVIAVAAGSNHSVALKSNGTVWTWGDNILGQLGDGTTTAQNIPKQVTGLTGVTAIAAGQFHTLALKSDGTLWVWGGNTLGQLGDGTAFNRTLPVQVNISSVTAIAAGSLHTLALKSDGTLWAWGSNSAGQLGLGFNFASSSSLQTPVQTIILTSAVAISAGGDLSIALTQNGTVYSWGSLSFPYPYQTSAALARPVLDAPVFSPDGGTYDSPQPVAITLPSSSTATVSSIALGVAHTLAVTSDAKVYAWGINDRGQVGLPGPPGPANYTTVPVPVNGIGSVKAVAAGNAHSTALKLDGTVWAWGSNDFGQLGTGQMGSSLTPVQVSNLTNIIAISTTSDHTLALRNDGTVWAWGYNAYGNLGDGTTTDRATPVQVTGLTGIKAIGTGNVHSLAVKSDGSVWAWGFNAVGQLGDGTTVNKSAPVRVSNLTNVVSVAGGYLHSVALRGDGTVWAWGSNQFGELGDGTNNARLSPVMVTGLSGVTAISAGGENTNALRNDGTMLTWGKNFNGQLGTGSTDPWSLIPVQALLPIGAQAIAASGGHAGAILSDKSLWLWGYNMFGQLADGSTFDRRQPVKVTFFDSGPVIHYTTNGADPIDEDPVIASGGTVLINRNAALKARAFRNGFAPSSIKEADYTITSANVIDDARFFVRQHYLDFLAREPDQNGWDYWTNEITSCGADPVCIHNRRIAVSDAFFFEPEFQQTGSFVLRLYRAAYGNEQPLPNPDLGDPSAPYCPGPEFHLKFPSYAAFKQDRAQVVGGPDLAQSQLALANDFVQRPEFLTKYPAGLSGPEFVNGILASIASASSSDLSSQSVTLNNLYNQGGRGLVMFHLANDYWNGCGATPAPCVPSNVGPAVDNRPFIDAEYNLIFVTTEYFGYLRRDGDANGLNFWWIFQVNRFPLRQPDIQHAMVCSFITSAEYQLRFGGTLTRSNQDCPQ